MNCGALPPSTGPLFPCGKVVATPAALNLLRCFGLSSFAYLKRHLQGDWGDLCEEDRHTNAEALLHGHRLFSSYKLQRASSDADSLPKLWIITEADRSVTTLLLPEDY